MKGSGLAECLQEIYGGNAVTHIESGKAVSRALRGHFLLQSAVYALRLDDVFRGNYQEEEVENEEIRISEEEKEAMKSLYEKLATNNILEEIEVLF